MRLDRTVRRIAPDGRPGPSEPLAAYRDTAAWVLLGDPGAGKTTAFEAEASRSPESEFVSARDFLTLDPAHRPEWRERTLLIDGLDEVRAGQADARTPFDEIRTRLDQLGKPRFRLSCREADWLGNNDRARLKAVSPDGEVVVLRLDPLSDDDARRLVSDLLDVAAQAAFFTELADRDLGSLLGNPQNLDLLVRVFRKSGQLPTSRLETFEQASALLAQERNEEHRIGGGELPVESIQDAAGWLSAVQLLSGAAGHCLSEQDAAGGYIPISAHGEVRGSDIHAVLRTGLFAADGGRRFRPAHAHLAAFLAARHLARLEEEGIPKNRILKLLAGHDGAPPTPLRGLVAWLAAESEDLRRPLIERDPAAVLMYGEVRRFTSAEKTCLLDSLGRNPSRLYESYWPSSAVAALASGDMETELVARLTNADRSDAAQSLVEVIAKALSHGGATGALSDALLAVVEDPTYWPQVRTPALDAWITGLADEPDRVHRLRTALDMIYKGHIKDPDRQLLGTLLAALYPGDFVSAEVWDYFDPPPHFVINRYHLFWRRLGEDCPDEHLPHHLDRLSDPDRTVFSNTDRPFLPDLPLQLLARALVAYGTRVETSRLFRWLQVGMEAPGKLTPLGVEPREATKTVTKWLQAHPDIQKALTRFALRTKEFRDLQSAEYHLDELLYRSKLPEDIGQWHLDEAVATDDRHLMERHLRGFLRALERRPVEVDNTLAVVRGRLADRPEAIRFLDENLKRALPEWRIQQRIQWKHLPNRTARTDTDFVKAVRSNETALRENRANAGLLHGIAVEYRAPNTPGTETTDRDKLLAALGGDEDLTDAAIAGIRRAPDREDLLSVEEILQLRLEQRPIPFALPVLLGLAERSAEEVLHLDEARLRAALAFRLARGSFPERAPWYSACLLKRPDLVAEVLILFGRRLLQNGDSTLRDLYQFAREDDYAEVAKKATLPLLRAFPLRARANQLKLLDDLLQSALVHCDDAGFRTVINDRTTLDSMTRTQRVHWLTAGLACDPEAFGRQLSTTSDSQLRASVLKSFYAAGTVHRIPRLTERLAPAALELLVRELGRTASPFLSNLGSTVVWGRGTSMAIEGFIGRLARSSEPEATEALRRLASDPELEQWRRVLQHARDNQRVVRRDANYRAPTPGQVIQALGNGPPAGADDLRELVVDRLERIAEETRTTNANLWRQFWNEDSGKPTTPKYEKACRDALLPRLQGRLPAGCKAEKEVQCAGDTCADLWIFCGEWKVPVEIKRTSHKELWKAVRNQLLPRYTNDPGTEGLGIYLVLWFGRDPKMRLAPNGKRPKTPKKLRKWLRAALTPEERERAAVLVMDVTPP